LFGNPTAASVNPIGAHRCMNVSRIRCNQVRRLPGNIWCAVDRYPTITEPRKRRSSCAGTHSHLPESLIGCDWPGLVENQLRSALCSGQITLVDAQKAIATDWTTALAAVR